ncbi:SAM-dependent methyltransferase [Mycobacterium sp. DL440]|uniref:SAM-dependent methyltransferase n=1 Tax=Mycobacterium sp. DL440 TaxID=2675523 RepID=UPI00141EE6CE|nr:SAM-dependent methyltransferase [Mycobacterium sp. DL440]
MNRSQLTTTLTGPPLTAVGVAVIRARETARDDRLYADPYAARFVAAAQEAYLDPTAPEGAANTWATVMQLAEVMYETRTIGVRIVDDALTEAAAAGRPQIALIGAGLDTHAFRLTWPGPVNLFEIDLPQLFAFKEPLLRDAVATCERHVIEADLAAGDWPDALVANGFDPAIPTHWVDHALMTLPTAAARAGVESITRLSAPGSRYGYPTMGSQSFSTTLKSVTGAADLYRSMSNVDRGLGDDARQWIETLGWSTSFTSFAELAASYPRTIGAETGSGTVTATRLEA